MAVRRMLGRLGLASLVCACTPLSESAGQTEGGSSGASTGEATSSPAGTASSDPSAASGTSAGVTSASSSSSSSGMASESTTAPSTTGPTSATSEDTESTTAGDSATTTESGGTSGSGSDTETESSETTGGACSNEDQEDNGTPGTAEPLSGHPCDPASVAVAFDGQLANPGDIDFYVYDVGWDACDGDGSPNPVVRIDVPNTEVCAYVECFTGTATDRFCASMEAEDEFEGRVGCCAVDGLLEFEVNCVDTGTEGHNTWLRVAPPTDAQNTCFDYAGTVLVRP